VTMNSNVSTARQSIQIGRRVILCLFGEVTRST
jgi:hypothetical protein